MKALDIGAGIGKCMIALENASFDVYGIEPSNPFYERALSRMKIDPSKIVVFPILVEPLSLSPIFTIPPSS